MSQIPPNPPGPQGPTPPPRPGWQGPPPQQPQPGGYPPNVPPAQWPQQGGPPSGGGNKTGLLVVVGLLVVAAVGGGIFLLTSGDDDNGGGGGGSPEGAVTSFVEAAQNEDCGAFIDSVTEASWAFFSGDLSAEPGSVTREEAVSACEENIGSDNGFFDTTGSIDGMEVTEESGDRATVAVTSTSDGETTTDDVPVAKEGGKWRVDFASLFGNLGDVESEDFETDMTVPEDLDAAIEDLEEQLEDELGTDFTLPED